MTIFSVVTSDEVERLLKSMPSTSSPLDFIQLQLSSHAVVHSQRSLLGLRTCLLNTPSNFQKSSRSHRLHHLWRNMVWTLYSDPANYRPISDINTISKILEMFVLIRLVTHASASLTFDAVQSACRRLHSTEIALLKIIDDIFAGFVNHHSIILIALSLRRGVPLRRP